jgi:Virulence protein RhuM family
MPDSPAPQSSIVLYQTEDGQTRIQCRFENETIWLTQALIAELFQVTVPTVNEHLKGIFDDGELATEATIRKFRIVRTEGARQVTRDLEHYSLPAILAVGFRVRSHRGTQFRQWATARLSEYLVKGFTMDDERHGFSLLIAIDPAPVAAESTERIRRFLRLLANLFDTKRVRIDTSVGNVARLMLSRPARTASRSAWKTHRWTWRPVPTTNKCKSAWTFRT